MDALLDWADDERKRRKEEDRETVRQYLRDTEAEHGAVQAEDE